jgi:hypothetical protein
MLATAIFASAAGILDDQNAPVIKDAATVFSPSGFTFSVTVDAEDSESGIMSYAFYQQDAKTKEYVLMAEQASNSYVYHRFPVTKANSFMVEVCDFAGNKSVESIDLDVSKEVKVTLQITDTQGNVAPSVVTLPRNSNIKFDCAASPNNIPEDIVWTTSDASFATVDASTGVVRTNNKTGTLMLTVTDTFNEVSKGIVLRIV